MKICNLFNVSFKYNDVRLVHHIFIVANNIGEVKNKFNKIFTNHPVYKKENIKLLSIDKMKLGEHLSEDVYV